MVTMPEKEAPTLAIAGFVNIGVAGSTIHTVEHGTVGRGKFDDRAGSLRVRDNHVDDDARAPERRRCRESCV